VGKQDVYAGYFDINRPDSPLVKGARTLSRQTYEPVPVGYAIDNQFSSALSSVHSPAWTVDRNAWEAAGGRTAAPRAAGVQPGRAAAGRRARAHPGRAAARSERRLRHPFGVATTP